MYHHHKLILLSATTLLAFNLHCYADDSQSSTDRLSTSPTELNQDGQRRPRGLEERMNQNDRQRLNHDLNNQSIQAYPDGQKMEERRKKMQGKMRERLQKADQNGDGAISRSEAEREMPGMARHFEQIDSNHDGILNKEELKAAHEKRREMREQRMRK